MNGQKPLAQQPPQPTPHLKQTYLPDYFEMTPGTKRMFENFERSQELSEPLKLAAKMMTPMNDYSSNMSCPNNWSSKSITYYVKDNDGNEYMRLENIDKNNNCYTQISARFGNYPHRFSVDEFNYNEQAYYEPNG